MVERASACATIVGHEFVMQSASQVSVRSALTSDIACIENMMQFYNYDLSESLPVNFAETGLYDLRPKAQYWSKPHVSPFLIYVDGELAGFAVVDDEVIEPESRYNMGYFFIARLDGKDSADEVWANKWQINFFRSLLAIGNFISILTIEQHLSFGMPLLRNHPRVM